jgi:hypothetical protein
LGENRVKVTELAEELRRVDSIQEVNFSKVLKLLSFLSFIVASDFFSIPFCI